MKKLILLILLFIPLKVYASDAIDTSKNVEFLLNESKTQKLNDSNVKTSITIKQSDNLTIKSSEENINQLYIVYEYQSKEGTITTASGKNVSLGKDGFLHEYVNLNENTSSISLKYNEDVIISEIRVFTEGDTPSDVQKWIREDETDLMIFSTHADDEQLFFAGVMPTYIDKGKKVHVVYLARHDVGGYAMPSRLHEQLNGLWALGVTDYPTFGLIPDAYSESIDVARKQMNEAGFTDDDVIKFDVDALRKYKPKVVLGHDENGEYGHGQHRLNIYTLKEAITKSADKEYKESSYESYSIPKFYIHLYDLDNKTVLNYDLPLEKYNGKTAYQVSKEGYANHLSQQYTWFTKWLNGNNNSYTSATQISTYNPAYWGLYKSDVGPDVNKNDLFENIKEEQVKESETPDYNDIVNDNRKIKESLDDLYDKYKDLVIIISGLVVIVGMILIVILKKNELK